MQNLDLAWKDFNIDLEALKIQVDILAPAKCVGISAGVNCTLHLLDEVTVEEVEALQEHWDSLTETSDEAKSYRSQAQIEAAKQSIRAGIPSKTWNQLVAIERKMVLGLEVTKTELIAAELL